MAECFATWLPMRRRDAFGPGGGAHVCRPCGKDGCLLAFLLYRQASLIRQGIGRGRGPEPTEEPGRAGRNASGSVP